MNAPLAEDVAAELVAARAQGRGLGRFPGDVPADMTAAYRIQDLAISRWPDSLAGWKIGYIAPDRRAAGDPDRLVGPVWARQCHRTADQGSPVEMAVFASGFAAVEAELVIRLGADLPVHEGGGWTAEEAAGLDQELLLGIEVASSPVPDINSLGPTAVAADFGNHNGLVLGPLLADEPGTAPAVITCSVDGRLVGEGSAENLPGGMHHGLATALDILLSRGQPVRAGMVFATGAITGIHPIGPGQHCRVEVRGGPAVELRTVDAGPPGRS